MELFSFRAILCCCSSFCCHPTLCNSFYKSSMARTTVTRSVTRREETAKHEAKTRAERSKTAQLIVKQDPFDRLNDDCVYMILNCLALDDLVRCELVSQ